jgi:hypothetical protein
LLLFVWKENWGEWKIERKEKKPSLQEGDRWIYAKRGSRQTLLTSCRDES